MTMDFLQDHQSAHSDFQMDYFITVKSGGTPYGCYKQALRELSKRTRGIEQLRFDRERLLVDIAELEARQRKWIRGRFARMRDAIDLRQKRSQLAEMDRAIDETRREHDRFLQHAEHYRATVGELTDERRAELDADMWEHRIRCMAALDLMTCGRLQRNTIEFLVSIPREMRQRLVESGLAEGQHQRLIEWFQNHDATETEQIPCLCGTNI